MSRIRRRGLRREPTGGWPLDPVFVGVATLRTTRELFRQQRNSMSTPLRAWDLALWSGVTPQGSADSLERLSRAGLVVVHPSPGAGHAPSFRIDARHPLVAPLRGLFEAERALCHRNRR